MNEISLDWMHYLYRLHGCTVLHVLDNFVWFISDLYPELYLIN